MNRIGINIIFLLIFVNTNAKETLRLGISTDLIGFLPAVDLALKTIENDETLPFVFKVTLNHSMVSDLSAKICIAIAC